MAYQSSKSGTAIDNAVDFIEKVFKIFYDGTTITESQNGMILQIVNQKLAWVKVLNAEEVSF